MELKYKEQRIRDLFVYNTNIFPVSVELRRHEIIITVKQSDVDQQGFTSEGIISHISKVTGRKITLNII